MKAICLHDRDRIGTFLRRDVFLNVYQLGDLDEAFWPSTTWYGLVDEDRLRAVALMYAGLSVPTLLAMGADADRAALESLVDAIAPLLPRRFYAHLGVGLSDRLKPACRVDSHGLHYKMALTDPAGLDAPDTPRAEPLSSADAAEVAAFFAAGDSVHSFEPSMLAIGHHFGVRLDGELATVAGVHVCSPSERVAALGNIATAPEMRRRGGARSAVAAVCRSLLATTDHIGLNVKADNAAAIALYEGLGFEIVGEYEECSLDSEAG